MTRRGIDKNIKKLKEQGLIRRVDPDKGGHWEVVAEQAGLVLVVKMFTHFHILTFYFFFFSFGEFVFGN